MNKVNEFQQAKKSTEILEGLEEELGVQDSSAVVNGSRDRGGNLRVNQEGRPKKIQRTTINTLTPSNKKLDQFKHRRQEVKGAVQLEIIEELSCLSENLGKAHWKGQCSGKQQSQYLDIWTESVSKI